MDQPNRDDDLEEADCGSTSWRIMTGRAKKGHLSKPTPPPAPSNILTPHVQSGPIETPTVPRPMKGRVTRSAGGTTTVSGVYSQSPATAGKMKKMVPAPPFGLHAADADTSTRSGNSDGTSQGSSTSKLRLQGKGSRSSTMVKGGVVRAVESASAIARDSNSTRSTLDEGDTESAHIKEEIQMPNLVPSSSSAAITTDTKSTLLKRSAVVGPDRSDSLEDELLEQEAAANIADLCCDEKDHAATTSFASAQSANSDPLGGHDSLEVLMEKGMELLANGAEKSNANSDRGTSR